MQCRIEPLTRKEKKIKSTGVVKHFIITSSIPLIFIDSPLKEKNKNKNREKKE